MIIWQSSWKTLFVNFVFKMESLGSQIVDYLHRIVTFLSQNIVGIPQKRVIRGFTHIPNNMWWILLHYLHKTTTFLGIPLWQFSVVIWPNNLWQKCEIYLIVCFGFCGFIFTIIFTICKSPIILTYEQNKLFNSSKELLRYL
jgi:hypothetical protein